MFLNQRAVAFNCPRAAAKRNDARRAVFEQLSQSARLDFAERQFALFVNDRPRVAPLNFDDHVIEVERRATQLAREGVRDGCFPRAHESGDDDAPLLLSVHRSVTESSS